MGLLSKILGSRRRTAKNAQEHSVVIHFYYGSTNLQHLYALDDVLRSTISDAGVGEYDGYEVAEDGSEGSYYMYGPDADKLFSVIHPLLTASCFMNGASVTLRYGPKKRRTPKRIIELPAKL